LDADLTIAGPINPVLFVSTTGTDSDWIVKLIDVYPEGMAGGDENRGSTLSDFYHWEQSHKMRGFQELVRGDVMRGKFRNSFEKPEPLTPGEITKIAFTMPDVYHTFQKGHRIMVQVQSTWFPLVDRNPQKFVDIYHASAADFQKAVQRVYRSGSYNSRLTLNVLQRGPSKDEIMSDAKQR
jgi:putative CocE/NonD family hydrolase